MGLTCLVFASVARTSFTTVTWSASAQIVSRPAPPGNSFLRSRETAVRLAGQRYRDAQSGALKAKTESEQKSAQRAVDSADSNLKNAEADLDRAQREYDRQVDRYNRDLESYQKYLESKKK